MDGLPEPEQLHISHRERLGMWAINLANRSLAHLPGHYSLQPTQETAEAMGVVTAAGIVTTAVIAGYVGFRTGLFTNGYDS